MVFDRLFLFLLSFFDIEIAQFRLFCSAIAVQKHFEQLG